MFFFTNGILDKINKRDVLNNHATTYSNSRNSNDSNVPKTFIRNSDNPAVLRIDGIRVIKDIPIVLLKLFDGLEFLEVRLDRSLWSFLSNEVYSAIFGEENLESIKKEKMLQKGSVLILNEYTFRDAHLEENTKITDMLTVLNYSIIGMDELQDEEINTITNSKCYAIKEINTSLNNMDWFLKARLVKSTIIKEFRNKNTGQEGKFIRLQFSDETGIIELVAFNLDIEKVKTLNDNKIYNIYNVDVKNHNKNYKAFTENTNCDFELVVKKNTIFDKANINENFFKVFEKNSSNINKVEDTQLNENLNKRKASEYIYLNKLVQKKEGELVSVLGIVSSIEEPQEIIPKNKLPITLRNFFICDQTEKKIKVSLWGKDIEKYIFKEGTLLVLANFKIVKYQGVQLSAVRESKITKIEGKCDHITGANELRIWWFETSENEISSSLKRTTTSNDLNTKKQRDEY